MTDMTEKERCARGCMWLGAGVGLAIALMLWLIGSWGFILSVVIGVILGVVASYVFSRMFCSTVSSTDQAELPSRPENRAVTEPEKAPASTAQTPDVAMEAPAAPEAQASAPVGGAATEATAGTSAASAATAKSAFSGMKPSKELKGQQELSTRKGSYKYVAPPVEKAAPKKAPPPAAPTGALITEGKPVTMTAARAGGADDLKLISGIGPKLEETLNSMGIYHFDQIAAWTPQEVVWVDSRMRIKGRIQRDNWIEQAKTLSAGGESLTSLNQKKF